MRREEQLYFSSAGTTRFWGDLLGALRRLSTHALSDEAHLSEAQRAKAEDARRFVEQHRGAAWGNAELWERAYWSAEAIPLVVDMVILFGDERAFLNDQSQSLIRAWSTTAEHIITPYSANGTLEANVRRELGGWDNSKPAELKRVLAVALGLAARRRPSLEDLRFLARFFGLVQTFPQALHSLSHLTPRKQHIYPGVSASRAR